MQDVLHLLQYERILIKLDENCNCERNDSGMMIGRESLIELKKGGKLK